MLMKVTASPVGSILGPFHPPRPLLKQKVIVVPPPSQRAPWKDRTKNTCSLREIRQADQRRGDSSPGEVPTPGASWAGGRTQKCGKLISVKGTLTMEDRTG